MVEETDFNVVDITKLALIIAYIREGLLSECRRWLAFRLGLYERLVYCLAKKIVWLFCWLLYFRSVRLEVLTHLPKTV